jgi:transposase
LIYQHLSNVTRYINQVDDGLKDFDCYKAHLADGFVYHKRKVFHTTLASPKYDGCNIHIYYDSERNQYLTQNLAAKLEKAYDGNIPAEAVANAQKQSRSFGVSMLMTNTGCDARQVYLDYKARWEIEEMFDTVKNTLSFNMKYETKYDCLSGWAFIEFLSLLMYFKLNGLLNVTGLSKDYSVKELLLRAAAITQTNASGKWEICNLTKKSKELFVALGVSLEPISLPIP